MGAGRRDCHRRCHRALARDELSPPRQYRRLSRSPGLRVWPAAARIRGGRGIAARLFRNPTLHASNDGGESAPLRFNRLSRDGTRHGSRLRTRLHAQAASPLKTSWGGFFLRGAMKTDTATQSDLDALSAFNRDYIHSVQHGDVQRFDEILAEDFLCSNPDGSLVDKNQFLAQTARPVTISGLSVHEVKVRILGDVAIIHARTGYTTADGEQRNGRYTDVWARRDGKWLAVSAHVTR